MGFPFYNLYPFIWNLFFSLYLFGSCFFGSWFLLLNHTSFLLLPLHIKVSGLLQQYQEFFLQQVIVSRGGLSKRNNFIPADIFYKWRGAEQGSKHRNSGGKMITFLYFIEWNKNETTGLGIRALPAGIWQPVVEFDICKFAGCEIILDRSTVDLGRHNFKHGHHGMARSNFTSFNSRK